MPHPQHDDPSRSEEYEEEDTHLPPRATQRLNREENVVLYKTYILLQLVCFTAANIYDKGLKDILVQKVFNNSCLLADMSANESI